MPQVDTTRQVRKILKAHNITDLETPEQLLAWAEQLGCNAGPKIALYMGIDFIQDQNGAFHLLEINPYPGMESILRWWGLPDEGVDHPGRRQDAVDSDILRIIADHMAKLATE